MSRYLLDWYSLSKEAAPGVLLGVEAATGPVQKACGSPSHNMADFMVGFESEVSPSASSAPCIALIRDNHVNELFAWLHTYSLESFPLSQFCRVEVATRWASLLGVEGLDPSFRGSVWASIIAGEMLANVDKSIEPKAVLLSWASSCFSYTMSRIFRMRMEDRGDWVAEAINRLRVFEDDQRFLKRRVSIEMLLPVWRAMLETRSLEKHDLRHLIRGVFEILNYSHLALLLENSKLTSNSAEQRIHGFDEFVDALYTQLRQELKRDVKVGPLIAAAALLAGGGTSHIDLLKPHVNEHPDCLPWFGLFAGMLGPSAWDSDWLRLVKGVERQIRGGFVLTDPLQSDLCWIEFQWLRGLSTTTSVFVDLPKYHNRLLSVEVLPGAAYQVRLSALLPENTYAAKTEATPESSLARQSLEKITKLGSKNEDLLMQLQTISANLQSVIAQFDSDSASPVESQGTLFGDKPQKFSKKSGGRSKNKIEK